MLSHKQKALADAVLHNDLILASHLLSDGVSPNCCAGSVALLSQGIQSSIEMASLLLEYGADVNFSPGSALFTPLYWAIMTEDPRRVEALIRAGANLAICAPMRRNALHVAASNSSPAVFDVILNAATDEVINQYGEMLHTPLMDAVQSQNRYAVKALAPRVSDINAYDPEGPCETALHVAALHPDREIIETLLSFGANRSAENVFRQRPIDLYLNENQNATIHDNIRQLLAP